MTDTTSKMRDESALAVLIVDDNEGVLTVLERYLIKQGLQVVACQDAFAAADLLSTAPKRFDAVLIDLQMPGLNGFELARHIRALDAKNHRHTPLLALTGSSELPDGHAFDALLRKPFLFDSLIPRIREVIARSR